MVAGVLEGLHSFRRVSESARRWAYASAGLTIFMGLLVLNAPLLAGAALTLLLAASFFVDGVQGALAMRRQHEDRRTTLTRALAVVGNLVVAGLLFVLWWRTSLPWATALAGGLRIFGSGWNMVTAPIQPPGKAGSAILLTLHLPDHPELIRLGERLAEEEQSRRPYDRRWVFGYVAVLFAIHVGRMQAEWTLVGLLAPIVAVAGDLASALLIAFIVIAPSRIGVHHLIWPLEHRGWSRALAVAARQQPLGWPDRLLRRWLTRRLRLWIRLRQVRDSLPFAIERGLQMGLPIVAVAVATVPIWGMSWYFNSENWAAAIYNSWAESRTDTWRDAMTRAILTAAPAGEARTFAVNPPGVGGDFGFLVIGDPGEGDASQHVLRDQIIRAGADPHVRFMIIASDVIYPTGSMKNYEANFWLPFKGFDKPVYAIPGNHDWYDALEGFVATFFAADAARLAMRARVEVDRRLTSTTDSRIAWLVQEAARLRREYGVPTGFQRAPYFQIQTERFAL